MCMNNDLSQVTVVRFNNYSNFDPNKCRNGGCYGFWRDYVREEDGRFRVEEGTTADMTYCPVCGSFDDHRDRDMEEYLNDGETYYTCGDFVRVSEEEVKQLITDFEAAEHNEEEFIEFFSHH